MDGRGAAGGGAHDAKVNVAGGQVDVGGARPKDAQLDAGPVGHHHFPYARDHVLSHLLLLSGGGHPLAERDDLVVQAHVTAIGYVGGYRSLNILHLTCERWFFREQKEESARTIERGGGGGGGCDDDGCEGHRCLQPSDRQARAARQ